MGRILLLAVLGLASCAQFPEVDARQSTVPANAPYPSLVPLDGLVAEAAATGRAEAVTSDVEARAAALRRRADALRGPVVSSGERSRLETGVAVPSG